MNNTASTGVSNYLAVLNKSAATPEELVFIRGLQHWHNDNIVDGMPCGDWHIERTPEQAARLLRVHIAKQREQLIAHLKSEAQIHGKASDEWRAAGRPVKEVYHTGAAHKCLAIIDHIERLP